MSEQSEKAKQLVKFWNDEIRAGRDYKKKYAMPEQWDVYKDYYRCRWPKAKGNDVPVNKTFSFGRSMIPRTYFRAPAVSVVARHPDYIWNARIVEALDNYLIRELSLKKTLKRSILDAFYGGVGPIKLGFDSEFGYIAGQATISSGETVTQMSDKEVKTRIEYRVNVKPGMPWASSVQPEDIITPWGYRDFESFPWVMHEYLRPFKDVIQDSKYEEDARGRVTAGYTRDADDPSRLKMSDYKPDRFCLLKEIRDYKHKKILVICQDQLLLEADDPLQIEGLPYEWIVFNEDPDHSWGIPDIRSVEPQVLELNQIRTQAMKHRRVAFLKLLVRKGVLKEGMMAKILDEDISVLEVDDQEVGLQQVMFQVQNHIPPDLWKEAEAVLADFREVVGFSRNEAGEFAGGTPPSAHEVVAVGQGSEIRVDERRDVVADVLSNIVRKWNQYIFKFWTKEKVIRIVGPDGNRYWMKYTGPEIEAEYSLRVDPESGQPITRANRMQLSEKLFMALRMDPFIDPMRLREEYIRSQMWVDPSVSLLMPNPEALKQIQQGATVGAPATGAGSDRRQGVKTFGSPVKPMTIQEAQRGGAS